MVTIELNKPGKLQQAVNFPTGWDDLTTPQLEAVAKNILEEYPSQHEAKAALFGELLNLAAGKKIAHLLSAEDAVINGYPLIDFLFTSNQLTKQPYPLLKVPNRMVPCKPLKMQGPASDFENITCGEFEDCEIFYTQFKQEPDPAYLVSLAAALYRPAGVPYMAYKAANDTYSHYDAERMHPHFKKLKPWQLYSIFLWYSGCREQLPGIFPYCFGGGASSSTEADYLVFTRCIHAGAGPKNGSRNQIRCMPLKEFFFDVNSENEKAEEQLKAMQNARK